MQIGRMSLSLCLVASLLFLPGWDASLAESGTIEFSDEAPQPSAEKTALGKAWSERVRVLAEQINRLSGVLQATALLRDSVSTAGQPTPNQLQTVQMLVANWSATRANLFASSEVAVPPSSPETFYGDVPQPQRMWSVNTDAIGAYVAAAINLAFHLKSIAVSGNQRLNIDDLPQQVGNALQEQSVWFDELVAEHGILNKRIRYYPYLQPQTPVSCNVINKFAQMLKCVEATANGSVGDKSWIFGPAQLNDYCIADNAQSYSSKDSVHLSIRAKRALADAAVFPQLVAARVTNPLGGKQLGLKCQ